MIDYSILSYAQSYYTNLGYQYIEVPWLVSKKINGITMPDGILSYTVVKGSREKMFIGSGEQGFLYLISKGHLPIGNSYQTITPCLRNDDFDETHTKYFMKNELIYVNDGHTDLEFKLDTIIQNAYNFFALHIPAAFLKKVVTDEGIDIYCNDVEIGSYGIRTSLMCDWVYGTGVAEPRFSRMAAIYGK